MTKYIKLLPVLLILANLTYSKAYSQSLSNFQLQEINRQLAEGCEAKELLATKVLQLKRTDTTIGILETKVIDLTTKVGALEQNNTISEQQAQACAEENARVAQKQAKSDKIIARQEKRKKFWRNTALIETGAIVIVTIILFL